METLKGRYLYHHVLDFVVQSMTSSMFVFLQEMQVEPGYTDALCVSGRAKSG